MPPSTSVFWPIAGLFVAALGVAVPIGIYLWSRSKKELACTVLSNTPVVSVRDDALKQVEVRFMGVPVKNASLVVVKLWNSGKVSIRQDDFETPITFTFKRHVLFAEAFDLRPSNLQVFIQANFTPAHAEVTVKPLLLNKGDSLSLKFFVADFDGAVPPPQARIAGVKHIVRKSSSTYVPSRAVLLGAIAASSLTLLLANVVSLITGLRLTDFFVGANVGTITAAVLVSFAYNGLPRRARRRT